MSKVKKVAYAGYDQGNTIMFHALSKDIEEEFFADNMSAFIALAPCLILRNKQAEYEDFINGDWKLRIDWPTLLTGGGPGNFNWRNEKVVEKFCNEASKPACSMLTAMYKLNNKMQMDIKAPIDIRSYF